MLDRRGLVVGDAFRLPSRDFNYYRDIFLLPPFLLFAAAGIFKPLNHQWVVGSESIGIALCALLFARERLVLFLGGVGFCAVRFVIAIVLTGDWRGCVGLLVSGVLLLVLGRFARTANRAMAGQKGPLPNLSWAWLLSCSPSEHSPSSTISVWQTFKKLLNEALDQLGRVAIPCRCQNLTNVLAVRSRHDQKSRL
jgi:hypothetical protein